MKYERLDKGCTAEVLAVRDGTVLLRAVWKATHIDSGKFAFHSTGMLRNIVVVSKDYFEKRYGVVL